ncbi:MAG: carbamoyltransferase HypF [Planctomycetes bacterium]|nr:carbamoyltransferase HypF [Planctomycetota bacterium]MBL7144876.1 carbamoyltransferase HypF [Phycisphaerae bacterium]
MIKRQKIFITGRVQGVGFRPAVYRLARDLGLYGVVYNDTKGVTIELQGKKEKIDEFLARLQSDSDKPTLAKIKTCDVVEMPVLEAEGKFTIQTSDSQGTPLSQVTVDIATCRDCLTEIADKEDFRYGYPFINCTNCGPRYSIVKNIPYDRSNTTMSVFRMCEKCAAQYTEITDRRFHAQPVACGECGPAVRLTDKHGKTIETQTDKVIAETARLLSAGKIVAIKGIGGFHLAVDALNNKAVERLRLRKKRDHKPFAMMTDSIEKVKKYALVSQQAEQLLKSPQSPIVLLPQKRNCYIAPSVAEGVNTYGFMLCYAPLHYLLFEQLNARGIDILVMTSGNISDEPLICKNELALERLAYIADAFLMHDREIFRQVDDSIVHLIGEKPVLLRRARGYVPGPIFAEQNCRREIFAAGADLKNTFCFAKQNQFICSEHIGDLEDAEVYHHYINSIEHLRNLFEVKSEIVACDLHPGYLSTQYALSQAGPKVIKVQHHWAHIASVLAEHGLGGPVIGLAADGTGYGTDGAVWGCECLIASLEKFERFGHLAYYQLAGADKASKEAIRPALSLLQKVYGRKFDLREFEWLLKRIEPDINRLHIISEQLEKSVNCVETSSLGRVFDAVAAMLGLGSYNNFEAQLPMALEAAIADEIEEHYDFELINISGEPVQLDFGRMIKQLITDIRDNMSVAVISSKFHNCLAAGLLEMANSARESTKLNTVALSGGVFCNRYLIIRCIKLLKKAGFSVLFNQDVPSNDGGISLGQAAIAAKLS